MQKHLTFKQKILVAGTLFGMFFGAGNLIFPVHLGQLAGRNVLPAMIGFIITAVGIPIMGVAAIGNTHSDGLQQLSNKVGKGYGYVFSCLLYLTIGPGFAIPRCATTSFTVGVAPMLSAGASESIALLIFSVIFFAIVLILSLSGLPRHSGGDGADQSLHLRFRRGACRRLSDRGAFSGLH